MGFNCLVKTHNAQQTLYGQITVNQGFGLVALDLLRIVQIAREIACLQQRPIHLFKQIQLIEIPGQRGVGMPISKGKTQP